MPSDYYLLLEGVKGETEAAGLTNNIELESWSWGVSNPASLGGKGLAAGKPSLSDLAVSFALEAASFQIIKDIVTGSVVKTATFTGRKTGGAKKPFVYLVITLTNCFISSFSTGGGSSGVPSANMSISYETIKYQYYTQKTEDGTVTSAGTTSYDIKQVQQS